MRVLAVASGDHPPQLEVRLAPDPQMPPPGYVVVRVLASALNRGEQARLAGAEDGHVFGWDVVGVVERCGEGHDQVVPGARVAVLALLGGGWAEKVTVRRSDLSVIPDGVSDSAAATLPVAGLTALRAVRTCPDLLGATVFVIGAGAVAWYAVQLAVLGGARVIGLARSAASAVRLDYLGAHQVLSGAELPQAACNLVLDTVGGDMTRVGVAACRPFGRLVIIGNLAPASTGILPSALVSAGCVVQGYRLVVDAESDPVGADLHMLLTWISQARLRPPPTQEIGWLDAERVTAALNDEFGPARTVLRMADA